MSFLFWARPPDRCELLVFWGSMCNSGSPVAEKKNPDHPRAFASQVSLFCRWFKHQRVGSTSFLDQKTPHKEGVEMCGFCGYVANASEIFKISKNHLNFGLCLDIFQKMVDVKTLWTGAGWIFVTQIRYVLPWVLSPRSYGLQLSDQLAFSGTGYTDTPGKKATEDVTQLEKNYPMGKPTFKPLGVSHSKGSRNPKKKKRMVFFFEKLWWFCVFCSLCSPVCKYSCEKLVPWSTFASMSTDFIEVQKKAIFSRKWFIWHHRDNLYKFNPWKPNILLEEIPNNHLRCKINPVNNGITNPSTG